VNLAICIIAFNRQRELEIILNNLLSVPDDLKATLIFSIDFSDCQNEIINICENFKWQHGPQKIIAHKENLGLKNHVLSCIDLASNFDLTVILEDDLVLSPFFGSFILDAYKVSIKDKRIGAISLYCYEKNEGNKMPFSPFLDKFDNFFIQYPSSWGFAITQDQSRSFLNWMRDNDCDFFSDDDVPIYIKNWGVKSWKKHFCRFLIRNNKYCLYPRFSLTTNPGSDGTHHQGIEGLYSVPVCQTNREWKIGGLTESLSIYDCNFQYKCNDKNNIIVDDGHYSAGKSSIHSKSKYINESYYLSIKDLVDLSVEVFKTKCKKLMSKLFGN
jgi:hypothetical protein